MLQSKSLFFLITKLYNNRVRGGGRETHKPGNKTASNKNSDNSILWWAFYVDCKAKNGTEGGPKVAVMRVKNITSSLLYPLDQRHTEYIDENFRLHMYIIQYCTYCTTSYLGQKKFSGSEFKIVK